MMIIVVFFFSSRRRHTRLQGDWSSDVCSSDLTRITSKPAASQISMVSRVLAATPPSVPAAGGGGMKACGSVGIGRGSCRERVENWVVAGLLKKKTTYHRSHTQYSIPT